MRNCVPASWGEIPFELAFDNVTSSTLKLPRGSYSETGEYPVIDQGEESIGGYTNDASLVHPGPLPVVIFGDHTRAVKYSDRPFVQGADGVKVLSPTAAMSPRFAYWALTNADIPSRGYARHYSLVRKLSFPLPPRSEQHRIVEAIESYLTRLDDAVASLERVQRTLERYRASVLNAAVEGRLLPTEAEPFERNNWKSLGEALVSLDQGWSPRCDREASVDPEEWGVIKTTAVQPLKYLETANKRLPTSLVPRPHLELRSGDLLVTRAGPRSRVGVCSLVRSTRPKLMICDKVYRLRCNPEVATPGYLELLLNAPPIVDDINELKTGISDSGVNLTQKRFKKLRLPLPSVGVQKQIEMEIARVWSIIDSAEANSASAFCQCTVLRQSILKWAFEGKLVEQDPSDEPASVLLERINAQRKAAEQDTPKSRKKRGKST